MPLSVHYNVPYRADDPTRNDEAAALNSVGLYYGEGTCSFSVGRCSV